MPPARLVSPAVCRYVPDKTRTLLPAPTVTSPVLVNWPMANRIRPPFRAWIVPSFVTLEPVTAISRALTSAEIVPWFTTAPSTPTEPPRGP